MAKAFAKRLKKTISDMGVEKTRKHPRSNGLVGGFV